MSPTLATENVFREVNEQVHDLSGRFGSAKSEAIQVICECGTQSCVDQIEMTLAEYESVRRDPALFAVRPDHLIADVERAEARNDRYWIVRKTEALAR
jgi:hypothetical protein